jgi:hypothetical protein
MEIKEFQQLSSGEQQQLLKAPALITVLIAAADGKVDKKETEWASKVIGYRDSVGDEDLFDYYHAVAENYQTQVNDLLASTSGNQQLIATITDDLTAVGSTLGKLNKTYADKLYDSWKSFAKQVAKASGGFLGFGDISEQEKQLMDLHMIKF